MNQSGPPKQVEFLTGTLKGLSFAILIFFLVSAGVSAQDFREGYIVRKGSDTVRGWVVYQPGKKGFERCIFKSSRKEKSTHFSPTEIEGYGVTGSKDYVAIALPSDFATQGKVFLLQLAKGPMSLYLYRGTFFVKKDSLITLRVPTKGKNIRIDTGSVLDRRVREEYKGYIGRMNNLLHDCSLSANEARYSEEDLTRLVNNYNRCKGIVIPLKAGSQPSASLDFMAYGGFMQSNLTVDEFAKNTFGPSKTIVGGIGMEYSSPRLNDKLFASLEFVYVKSLYQGYHEGTHNGNEIHQDIYLNISQLKIPLGIRYNFGPPQSTPYLRLGILEGLILTKSARTLEDVISAGVVQTSEEYGGYQFRNSLGVWGAMGYQKLVTSRFSIFAEFRYEYNYGFLGNGVQAVSHYLNYNAILGIRY